MFAFVKRIETIVRTFADLSLVYTAEKVLLAV